MTAEHVCPKAPISKSRLSTAIAAGWSRVQNGIGRGVFADRMDCDAKTVERAIAGPSLPTTEHLLNSLVADPTALAEVLALYGLQATPLQSTGASDIQLATNLSTALTEFLTRISDGKRCHVDDAVLAVLFRQLIPQMQSVVAQDDARKGLRAVANG